MDLLSRYPDLVPLKPTAVPAHLIDIPSTNDVVELKPVDPKKLPQEPQVTTPLPNYLFPLANNFGSMPLNTGSGQSCPPGSMSSTNNNNYWTMQEGNYESLPSPGYPQTQSMFADPKMPIDFGSEKENIETTNMEMRKLSDNEWNEPVNAGFMFSTKSLEKMLSEHNPANHGNTRKNFACIECSKSFSRLNHLTRHNNTVHCGARIHLCHSCPLKFKQYSHMIMHINNVHKGIKEYRCSRCDKTFSRNYNLQRHLQAIH